MTNRTAVQEKTLRTGVLAACVAGGMLAFSFAAIPLYEAFCRVTGFGGTTQVAEASDDPVQVLDEKINVRFDASKGGGMEWDFKAVARDMDVFIGESNLAFYQAHNPTDRPITGMATFNVTPLKVGAYFVKIDCFCFQEQTLQPGQTIDMPVSFYVDPEIKDDEMTEMLEQITLSYTFYEQALETADASSVIPK